MYTKKGGSDPLGKYLDDFLFIVGGGCITYGVYLKSEPYAWITGGVFLITYAALAAVNLARESASNNTGDKT